MDFGQKCGTPYLTDSELLYTLVLGLKINLFLTALNKPKFSGLIQDKNLQTKLQNYEKQELD